MEGIWWRYRAVFYANGVKVTVTNLGDNKALQWKKG